MELGQLAIYKKKDKLDSYFHFPAFQHIGSTELRARKSTCPSINGRMRTWSGMEEMQEILQGEEKETPVLR